MYVTPRLMIDARAFRATVARTEQRLEQGLKNGLRPAAQLVVSIAKRTTRFRDRTKRLRRSIRKGGPRGNLREMKIDVIAGGTRRVHYAEFVEYGTPAHIIRPKNGKALAFNGIVRPWVNHPGTSPRRFMATVEEQSGPGIDRIMQRAAESSLVAGGFGR